MWNWWEAPKMRWDAARASGRPVVLLIGPKKYGWPVLVGADGRMWEAHPLQYTRAWRLFYRYMRQRQALVLLPGHVWPLSEIEVLDHVRAQGGQQEQALWAQAGLVERALLGARPFS